MAKPYFDPKYLDKYDPICRELARRIFAPRHLILVDSDLYDVDQELYDYKGFYGYMELEYADSARFLSDIYVSLPERGINGVSIPGRKAKWFGNGITWWMNFSSDLSHYIILHDLTILRDGVWKYYKTYNNPTTDEGFFVVPLDHPQAQPHKIPTNLLVNL